MTAQIWALSPLRLTLELFCCFVVFGAVSSLFVRFGRWLFLILFRSLFGRAVFVYRLITFPGIFFHEIFHAFFALITGAKVSYIRFSKGTGMTYIIPRGPYLLREVQLSASASGPAVGGTAALGFLLYVLISFRTPIFGLINSLSGPWLYLCIYLAVSTVLHSDMSWEDIKAWFAGLPGCLLLQYAFNLVLIEGLIYINPSIHLSLP